MVKDASVAHPRWAEWSQVLSSVLNIEVLSVDVLSVDVLCMVSSSTSLLSVQTPAADDLILSNEGKRKKDRVCTRSKKQIRNQSLELKLPQRCRYGFGVALAGAAGLAGAGFAVGFGAVLPTAGAGTPDCAL